MKHNKYIDPIVILVVFAILAFVYIVVSGCTQMPTQKLTAGEGELYRRDMILTVNGITREGTVTVPLRSENVVHVTAAGDLDLFVMANCMSEKVKPKAWNVKTTIKSGLFGWSSKTIDLKKEVEFTYVPQGMETLGSCPLELYGFAKDGKHSWGFIDFQTDTFKLQGTLVCNGDKRAFDGVEACQSKEGLFQQLSFTEEVFMSPDPGCELDKTVGKDFTFQMPPGRCVYRIKGKDTGLLGKLTLIGYNKILIRE